MFDLLTKLSSKLDKLFNFEPNEEKDSFRAGAFEGTRAGTNTGTEADGAGE